MPDLLTRTFPSDLALLTSGLDLLGAILFFFRVNVRMSIPFLGSAIERLGLF